MALACISATPRRRSLGGKPQRNAMPRQGRSRRRRGPTASLDGAWRSAKLGHWDRRLNATQSGNFKPLVFGEIHAAGNNNTVHNILTNPIYTGAYAFGRTTSRVSVEGGRKHIRRGVQKPMAEWDVLIKDHNAAYITW